jgi:urease accessory protein
MTRRTAACAAILLLLPGGVCAHGWGGTNTPLYDGILHVLLNPSFILPVAGAALLASQGGRELLALAQVALAGGVAAGSAVTFIGLSWSGVAVANRLFIVAAGLLVALDARLPRPVVLAVVMLGGGLTGHELLVSEPPAASPVWFCLGAVLGAMVLQGGVGALTLPVNAPWAKVAVRITGSWIAAVGIIYAGFLLMPAA